MVSIIDPNWQTRDSHLIADIVPGAKSLWKVTSTPALGSMAASFAIDYEFAADYEIFHPETSDELIQVSFCYVVVKKELLLYRKNMFICLPVLYVHIG